MNQSINSLTDAGSARLDLIGAGRVLDRCRWYRDGGISATLWEVVAPELLGESLAEISWYATQQLASDCEDADAWSGIVSALRLHRDIDRRCRAANRGSEPVSRGLHDVVSVVGDVTAVVATVRAVATPIAALVRRALDRRNQRRQEAGEVQIECDLPPCVGPVELVRS